jgi:hypothetical protein
MGKTRPLLDYLSISTTQSLESFELIHLNASSNTQKQLLRILSKYYEEVLGASRARSAMHRRSLDARQPLTLIHPAFMQDSGPASLNRLGFQTQPSRNPGLPARSGNRRPQTSDSSRLPGRRVQTTGASNRLLSQNFSKLSSATESDRPRQSSPKCHFLPRVALPGCSDSHAPSTPVASGLPTRFCAALVVKRLCESVGRSLNKICRATSKIQAAIGSVAYYRDRLTFAPFLVAPAHRQNELRRAPPSAPSAPFVFSLANLTLVSMCGPVYIEVHPSESRQNSACLPSSSLEGVAQPDSCSRINSLPACAIRSSESSPPAGGRG